MYVFCDTSYSKGLSIYLSIYLWIRDALFGLGLETQLEEEEEDLGLAKISRPSQSLVSEDEGHGLGLVSAYGGVGLDLVSDWFVNVSVLSRSRGSGSRLGVGLEGLGSIPAICLSIYLSIYPSTNMD